MGGFGLSEILVIMLVALVAIGPKKLPGVAKALGRGIAEFRNAMDEMRATVYKEVQEPMKKAMGDERDKELKETSAEYLDRLLAEREKARSATEAKADEVYAGAADAKPEAEAAGEPHAGEPSGKQDVTQPPVPDAAKPAVAQKEESSKA